MQVSAVLGISEAYTRRKLLNALSQPIESGDLSFKISKFGGDWETDFESCKSQGADTVLFWLEYEDIDFQKVLDCAIGTSKSDLKIVVNSYCFRKGLIRKAHLAFYINKFALKRPNSILKKAFPETHFLELADAEYLDEALNEAYEIEQYLTENEDLPPEEKSLFILKPSLADKAAAILLFDSRDELEEFFETRFSECDEGDLQFMREWVVQKYIDRPLLLNGGRKFHIRAYVVAVGALKVYLYGGMLALFAKEPYDRRDMTNKFAHITNTCVQAEAEDFKEEDVVKEFWDLDCEQEKLDNIFDQMKVILADVFEAVVNEASVFQPLPNCFEIYGFDFLVDENLQVYVLEANAFPDFKQTGERLEGLITNLFMRTVEKAVFPLVTGNESTLQKETEKSRDLHIVLDKNMKRDE
jgi:tubulin--tyrosine ligase